MANLSRRDVLKWAAVGTLLPSAGAAAASQGPPKGGGGRGGPPSNTFDVVFEGGGIKGVAFVGALGALLERGYKLRRLIGSSAGAIAATCLAAGYDTTGLRELLTERTDKGSHRFSTFLEPPKELAPPPDIGPLVWRPFQKSMMGAFALLDRVPKDHPKYSRPRVEYNARSWLALLANGAIADDKAFLRWMGDRLADQKMDRDITLKDFHEKTRPRGVQLSLVATDVSAQQVLLLNHHTAPGVPVVQAVRMSMGIPLLWPEVEWERAWGTYRKASMWEDGEGHRVVDGGILSNFPLRFFLDGKHSKPEGALGPPPDDRGAGILGLLLDENKEGPEFARRKRKHFAQRLTAYQSLSRLIDTMTSAWDREAIKEYEAEAYICRIGVKGVDTLDFDLDERQLSALVDCGGRAMTDYLTNRQRSP